MKLTRLHLAGASGNGSGLNATSEYVRQELRAVVGARTGQGSSAPATPQSVPQASRLPTQLHGQQVSPADLEALGLTFEMPTSGKYFPMMGVLSLCATIKQKTIHISVQELPQEDSLRSSL